MARGASIRFRRFARGLNTADGPYGLQEGYSDDPSGLGSECRDCLNVVSKDRGNIRRRDGISPIGQTAPLASPYVALSADSVGQGLTSYMLVPASNGTLYGFIGPNNGTALTTGLSTSAPWQWARHTDGWAYGSNGIVKGKANGSTYAAWTLTSPSTAVSSPNTVFPAFIRQAGNRVWMAGDTARPYSVFQSAINDPTVLEAEYQFNPGSGFAITGLGTVGPYVAVFTEQDIHIIYDLETGANRRLAIGVGTLAPRSIVESDRGMFFLDPSQGVMLCDGASQPRAISTQILPDMLAVTQQSRVSAAYLNGHYYLRGLFGTGSTRYIYDYDAELNSWWKHQEAVGGVNVRVDALTTWDYGFGMRLVAGGGLTDLFGPAIATWWLFNPSATTDLTDGFTSRWVSPYHLLGPAHLRKRVREIRVDGRGSVTAWIATDFDPGDGNQSQALAFGTSGSTSGQGRPSTSTGTVAVSQQSILTPGAARAWSLAFVDNLGSSRWQIDSYTFLLTPRVD